MKRKFLTLICIVALLLSLASCSLFGQGGDEPDDTCEHTYSDRWSTSSTEHWHAATCEHVELKTATAPHEDADQDGACDVCSYEIGHEHTYADTWTSNDTHHWKVATCSHTEEKGELGAHEDSDRNGACDICSTHVHVLNLHGFCTVCQQQIDEVDISDITVVLPIAVKTGALINGGTISYSNICRNPSGLATVDISKNIIYTLGGSAAYYKVDSSATVEGITSSDIQESWFDLMSDDYVFGVYRTTYDGEVGAFELNDATLENLIGYYYAVSTLTDAYGAENLLDSLYNLSQSASASEYSYNYAADTGVYTFSFDYLAVNEDTAEGEGNRVDFYEVEVSFTLSDNGAITSLSVDCDCYTNCMENEEENDYTYDQNTNTITMKDTAVADNYTFIITQTEGERTYTTEHPKSEFVPEDFDIFLDSECTTEIGETVEATVDKVITLYLGNFSPAGTSISYIADSFFVTCDADPESLIYYEDAISATFLANIKVAGTYTFVITAGDIVKEVTVIATAPVIDDSGEQPENSVRVEITENYDWETNLGEFTAPADGDYTFYIEEGVFLGAITAGANTPWADFNEKVFGTDTPAGGSITVSLLAGETYSFYVSSPEKNMIVYIPYTVSAYTGSGDIGGGDDDNVTEIPLNFDKSHQIEQEDAIYSFVAGSAGTLTLAPGAGIMGTPEFYYCINDGATVPMALSTAVNLELAEGDKIVITVIANGAYSSLTADWSGEIIDDGGNDDNPVIPGDNLLVIGANTIVFTDADVTNGAISYTLVVNAEGTYTFVSNDLIGVVYDADGMQIGRGSVYLTEGVYTVAVVIYGTAGAGTYTINVEYTSPVSGDNGDGSESNPFTITELPTDISFYSDTINKVYYLYTANESGYIYITLSIADDSWCDMYLYANGMIDGSVSYSSNFETVAKFPVQAGNTYRIGLGTFNIAGDTTFSLAFNTEDIGGGNEGGDNEGGNEGSGDDLPTEIDGYLYAGEENLITVTDEHLPAAKLYYILSIWETGEYNITSNNLFVTKVMTEDGTVIARNDNWAYELEAWCNYIIEISTEYVGTAGDYSIDVEYIYPYGHQYNPFYYTIGEDAVASYAGNYAPYIWYTFYANTTGTANFVTDLDGVTFIICGGFGYEIEGVGSVSLDVVAGRWYYIAVAAFDSAEPVDIHFTGTITVGEIGETDGTANLPHNIVIGENVANVPMYDGVYFMYIPEVNGVLNLTSSDPNCSWYVTTDLFIQNAEQVGDLSIQLYVGDVAYIYVTTGDWSAADVIFNASFTADPIENWYEGSIIVDGTDNRFTIEENTFLGFQLSGMGTYTVSWDADVIVFVDEMPLTNGGTVTCTNPYWGPYFKIYFEGYAAGSFNISFTQTVPEAVELELGENDVLVTDPAMGTTVSLFATETATYLITVGFETVLVYDYSNYFEGDVLEITVFAGETVTLQVCSYYYAPGYYSVNVAVKAESDDNTGSGAEGATSGSFTFVVPSDWESSAEQSFVAAENGTYVITAEGYDAINNTYLQYYSAAGDTWVRIDNSLPYSIELTAGESLNIRLFCWDSADTGKTIVVSVALA